jgi:hypothetical protein
MKIIHKNGFSDAELAEFRPVVYKNVMESAHQVVNYMTKAGLNCVEYSNRVRLSFSVHPLPSRPRSRLLALCATLLSFQKGRNIDELLFDRPWQTKFSISTSQRSATHTLTSHPKLQKPSTSYGKTLSYPRSWTNTAASFI